MTEEVLPPDSSGLAALAAQRVMDRRGDAPGVVDVVAPQRRVAHAVGLLAERVALSSRLVQRADLSRVSAGDGEMVLARGRVLATSVQESASPAQGSAGSQLRGRGSDLTPSTSFAEAPGAGTPGQTDARPADAPSPGPATVARLIQRQADPAGVIGTRSAQQRFHQATDLVVRRTTPSARLLNRSTEIAETGPDPAAAANPRQRRSLAQLATTPAGGDADIGRMRAQEPSRIEISPALMHVSAVPAQQTDSGAIQRTVAPEKVRAGFAPMRAANVPMDTANRHHEAGVALLQRLVLPNAANLDGSYLAGEHRSVDSSRNVRLEGQVAARVGDGAAADRTHAADPFGRRFRTPLEGTRAAPLLDGSSIPAAVLPTPSWVTPSPVIGLVQRKAGSSRGGVAFGGVAAERAPVSPFTLAAYTNAAPVVGASAVASGLLHASAAPQVSNLPLHRSNGAGGDSGTIARRAEVGQPTASAAAPAPVPAAVPPAGRAGPDVQQIAEQVARLLGRRLEVERERRGIDPWAS